MALIDELRRKAIHLTTSLIPLTYALWGSRAVTAIALLALSTVMLVIESFRHRDNWAGRTFRRLFSPMLREKEKSGGGASETSRRIRWLGATPYCLASLLCVLIFPKPIAVLALLYLAIGDTSASLVGMKWGRTRIGEKSIEGTAAFVVSTCAIAAVAHALVAEDYGLGAGISGAIAAASAELLIPWLDDNLTIPLAAGLAMTLFGMALGSS